MEPDNSKWKEAVEKSFRRRDIKEEKTTIDIPRERKGVFPTKEYDVKKHL